MSKNYGVSDKHTGPWLGESDKPDEALAKGRAMWGDTTKLYVAKIAPMDPAEGLPNMAVFIGDIREALVEKHGSGADAVFDGKEVIAALDTWWEEQVKAEFVNAIEQVTDIDHMVTSEVKIYSPGNDVKVGDFK